MSTEKRLILIFEDDPKIAQGLSAALKTRLGSKLAVKVFDLSSAPAQTSGPYEDRLVSVLSRPEFKDLVLIVTDRDLSANEVWRGLSEAAVTRAAEKLGLPVASYRQAKPNAEDRLKRIPGNGQLELPFDTASRAARIVTLAKGFAEMERLLGAHALMKPGKGGGKKQGPATLSQSDAGTPGNLLARILKQPDIASRFDLFACGDQRAIAEILKASEGNGAAIPPAKARRLVVALGVWLADLVMEYPGLLLNKVAAASYLDIHPNDFDKPDVQKVFASALYQKLPFADSERPMWWRHLIDDLVNDSSMLTGRDLCTAAGIKRIRFCPCSVRPALHAGYYCMASEKPLSDEESSGRVSWFPIGADLARLTDRTHRALAPWIGS